MIELKSINTSHVTLETLKAFNEWLSDIFKCRIAFIDQIMCYRQYAAETSWKNTTLSMQTVLNNISIWQHRLLVQYLRNNYQREYSSGDVTKIVDGNLVAHQSTCGINLRTSQLIGMEADIAGAGSTVTEVKASHGEIRIPVPEGYDGNQAFVELLVPYEVINAMHLRGIGIVDWEIDTNLTHPLMEPNINRENASVYGWYRPHALLFYQRYTKKGVTGRNILKIDVAKSKNWISILTHADTFSGPFDLSITDRIEPIVEVKISCYKYGAM